MCLTVSWPQTDTSCLYSLSKSYYSHICALRCIRPYLDFKTVSTIATSIVYSKLDYCNSLKSRVYQMVGINRLQQIQNSLARTVVIIIIINIIISSSIMLFIMKLTYTTN